MTIQVQDTRERNYWRMQVDQITRSVKSAEFYFEKIKGEAGETPLPELMNELKLLTKKIEDVR
tara:strand:- start:5182 stop:5370 length:189 start_codon:yes stop_codon:yes gene_type:complete